MSDPAACRCDRFTFTVVAHPCPAPATQEDMLCDNCRKPCTCTIPGRPHLAYSASDFRWITCGQSG